MLDFKRILIAEDEPSILMSLDFLFRKQGFEVFVARDGQEALTLAEKHRPGVFLLDIMMPQIDGYSVCEQIKQNAAYAGAKVVFLTAKTQEADIEKGYAVGADLYITKPFSNKKLVAAIQSLLP